MLVYRNAGSRTSPSFVEAADLLSELTLPPASTPLFADLNGDGTLELVAGTVSGGLVYYRR